MKKVTTFICALIAFVASHAQPNAAEKKFDTSKYKISSWTDISMYQVWKLHKTPKLPIMWFSHEHIKFFLESRLNFDWNGTAAIVAGKTFQKKDAFWATPKAGVFFGFLPAEGYNGATFEINMGGKWKRLTWFTMNQLAVSFQKKNPPFLYQYTDVGCDLKYVFLSGSFQIYYETRQGSEVFVDIGPQVKVPIKKFYAKLWYTGDPNPKHKLQKITVGLGYQF
jgi:hypothetical protein